MERFCEECTGETEHEIWCSLNTAVEDKAPVGKSLWVAVDDRGARHDFSMAPGVTIDRALAYANRSVEEFDFQVIVSVEAK